MLSYEIKTIQYTPDEYGFINDNLYKELCSFLNVRCRKINKELTESNLDVLLKKYIDILKADYSESDDEYTPKEIYFSFEVTEVYSEKYLKILEQNQKSYTGGAHGNYNKQYTLYDTRRGDLINYSDIFDYEELNRIGEEYFLRQFGIQKTDELEDSGYKFEKNKFYLPNNFTIEEENLRFIYNPYEIASYAEGIIEIEIPIIKLKNIIKEEYKFIIN